MRTRVHILVTIRKPELLPAALLVFRTLRTGFPSADVVVWGNGLSHDDGVTIGAACRTVNGSFRPIGEMSHGQWIEHLLAIEERPFWICDTDVIFWESIESWFHPWDDILFAGRKEPSFWCEFTQAQHVERLHPSLMYLNAPRLRTAMRSWPARHPWLNSVETNLVRWHWMQLRGQTLKFFDTCAGLHHALEGYAFDEIENEAFEHLFCGTYLDLIGHTMPGLADMHRRAYLSHESARGLYEQQKEFYAANQVGTRSTASPKDNIKDRVESVPTCI